MGIPQFADQAIRPVGIPVLYPNAPFIRESWGQVSQLKFGLREPRKATEPGWSAGHYLHASLGTQPLRYQIAPSLVVACGVAEGDSHASLGYQDLEFFFD